MGKIKQGDARPAYSLEKEAVREEIQTGLQTGVEILAGNVEKDKETDHFHNTKYLLKQYRRVEYSIRISEADLNLRMEMQHGMRLSTLKVNSELAGIDLSGTKLENHARSVICWKLSTRRLKLCGKIETVEIFSTRFSTSLTSAKPSLVTGLKS